MIASSIIKRVLAAAALCGALTQAGCKSATVPPFEAAQCPPAAPPLPGDTEEFPGPPRFWNKAGLVISPARILAQVGSEVPMFAGVCDGEGHLQPYEKVEWMLDHGGAGSFVSVNEPLRPFYIDLVSSKPRKVDNNYAVSETLPENVILTRGTPTINDDTVMPRGYTWVTVTSPREGTSYVTAYAPDVYSWDARQKSAVIYWIDADWVFPAPVCAEPGSHATLTTCVSRHTTKAPLADWIVKYSITGGAPAGFAPDNSQTVEIATNDEGQSSVEVIPAANASGSTCISMELIRSECASGGAAPERLSVATAATQVMWTAPQAGIRVIGPGAAAVGAVANYRVEVSNPGGVPVNEATVTLTIPAGLAYIKAEPAPESTGGTFVWKIGQIPAGEVKAISLDFRVEQAGELNLCATLAGADGVTAQNCSATNVGPGAITGPGAIAPAPMPANPPIQPPALPPAGGPVPTNPPANPPTNPTFQQPSQQSTQPPGQAAAKPIVELHFTGPQTAVVGGDARFELEVVNRGNVPAESLIITDRFDTGLEYGSRQSPIQNSLGTILAGQSKKVAITFRVTKAGKLCHTMEVTNQAGVQESAQACVTVAEQPAMEPAIKCDQPFAHVGDTVNFTISVVNTGDIPAQQVRATVTFDQGLKPTQASPGVQTAADGGLVWTVDTLPPRGQQTWTVQCSCVSATQQACGKVAISDQTGLNLGKVACLQIVPAVATPGVPANLQLAIGGTNPAKVGSDVNYTVVVTNAGTNFERQVKLTVAIPQNMTFVSAQAQATYAVNGQNVEFQPILEMRPGEKIPFSIRLRAAAPGAAQVSAQVTSSASAQPLSKSATTNVFAE